MIKYYIVAVKLICISTLLSLIFYYTISVLGILDVLDEGMFIVREKTMDTMFGQKFGYNYFITPFGLIIEKIFFTLKVPRILFFFGEPSNLAGLCILNMAVFSKYTKVWWLNLFCGIFTFSYLFFIFIFFYILWNRKYLILPAALLVYIFFENLTMYSSLDSRVNSMYEFVDQLSSYNSINQLLFGSGYNEVGYPIGILFLCDEIGIIGLLIIFILASFYYQKNNLLLFSFVLSMLVIPVYKYPVYWFVFIVLGILSNRNNEINKKYQEQFV